MFKASKKYKRVSEIESKFKAFWHFKVFCLKIFERTFCSWTYWPDPSALELNFSILISITLLYVVYPRTVCQLPYTSILLTLLYVIYPRTVCQLPYTSILLTLLYVVYLCTVCQLPCTRISPTLLHVVYPRTAYQLPYRETNHIQGS